MAYDVHIFTIVRVKVSGLDAVTPTDAIAEAKETVDFGSLLAHPEFDWAEEHSHYLVDVVGDEEYEQTEWFLDADHVGYVNKMLEDGTHQA